VCNLYSITTNQAAIINLFRVINRYVGNLAPMPGVFPDYPAPIIRNVSAEREMVRMRWGMPPPRIGGSPLTNIRNAGSPHWHGWLKPENRCVVPFNSFAEYAPEPNPETKSSGSCPATRSRLSCAARTRKTKPPPTTFSAASEAALNSSAGVESLFVFRWC
jgi:putative SOS response-associated peptidase YedK